MEQSSITGEISPTTKERSAMSAAEDVLEMKSLTNDLADRLVGKGAQLQTRITAILRAFGNQITENRAKEFLKGQALRVDGWEKDYARRRRAELREREQIERENEHLRWLECEIARHRASGEELRGPLVNGLEHVLRNARNGAGTMAIQATADDFDPNDFSD